MQGGARQPDRSIAVGGTSDGVVVYRVALSPPELPSITPRDLEAAWDDARELALETEAGSGFSVRCFRFAGSDGRGTTDLLLADLDARAWADAVDRRSRLSTRFGLSVCLRLLGLIELLAAANWTTGFCRFRRGGVTLDPALIAEAARRPLTPEGRLDETGMRAALAAAPRRS